MWTTPSTIVLASPIPNKTTPTTTDSATFATNCPEQGNPSQGDVDSDGVGNVCDSCPELSNPDNLEQDGDSYGDACDTPPNAPKLCCNGNWAPLGLVSDGFAL